MIQGIEFDGRNFNLDTNATISVDGDVFNLNIVKNGINSLILQGVAQQNYSQIIVKVSKFASSAPKFYRRKKDYRKRYQRFIREIEALELAKGAGKNSYIVEMYQQGNVQIPITKNGKVVERKDYPFFVMEQGDGNLQEYLSDEENELSLQQKIILFRNILICLNELHQLGIYHRDIKPDNIFFFGETWKIGDLGLIAHRDEDEGSVDAEREKIGPFGRLSPEATNKCIGNWNARDYQFDHAIDDYSDMYQIGLLFWYICQGEIPNGNLSEEDFAYNHDAKIIFSKIFLPLLQYSKKEGSNWIFRSLIIY